MERKSDDSGGSPHELRGRRLDQQFVLGGHAREKTAADAEERLRRQLDLARRLREEDLHQERLLQRESGSGTYDEAAPAIPRSRLRRYARVLLVCIVLVGLAGLLTQFDLGRTRPEQAVPSAGSAGSAGPAGAAGPTGPRAQLRPTDWPNTTSGSTERRAPAVTGPAVPGPFEVLQRQDDSQVPVGFDPCRDIRYVVNPANASPEMMALVPQAINEVSSASGLKFVDAGLTDEPPSKDREPYQPQRYGDRWAPILISWSDDVETPGLGGYIVGQGGPEAVKDPHLDDTWVYVTGAVTLDTPDLDNLMSFGAEDQVRAVVIHELGHVLGLDHVADPTQIMYSEGSPGVTRLGNGDLAGLAELGRQDCHPDI